MKTTIRVTHAFSFEDLLLAMDVILKSMEEEGYKLISHSHSIEENRRSVAKEPIYRAIMIFTNKDE